MQQILQLRQVVVVICVDQDVPREESLDLLNQLLVVDVRRF